MGNDSKSVSGQGLHRVVKEYDLDQECLGFQDAFFHISIPSAVKNPQKFLIGARVVEIVGKDAFQVSFSAQSNRFCS